MALELEAIKLCQADNPHAAADIRLHRVPIKVHVLHFQWAFRYSLCGYVFK